MVSHNRKERCDEDKPGRLVTRSGAGMTEILLTLAALAIIVGILFAFFLPAERRARPAARRAQCKNNLKQIGIALHNYHETHGVFPPACTVDANGTPLHSWRTVILPFLDQKELYERIDLTKPWNDPANAEAFATRVDVFSCPSANLDSGFTTYQALVGAEYAFQPGRQNRIREILDGTSNTVLVIDASPSIAVHWMEPADPGVHLFLNCGDESEFQHTGGLHALLGDGAVRFIPHTVPRETREALSTIDGGEIIDPY